MKRRLLIFQAILLFVSLLAGVPAGAEPKRTFLPPQLAKIYLEKIYRGQGKKFLYSKMSTEFQKQVSFKDFKKLIKDRDVAVAGTRIPLKLLRQEILSAEAGLLYYVVQVNQPAFSFKKDFYCLERFRMCRENGDWKLKEMPARLMVSDMKEKCSKNDFVVVYGLTEQDRAAEVLAYSRLQAVSTILNHAAGLAQKKEYRRALVEYQKVLQLQGDHPDALNGSAFCKESLARNENAD